MPACPKGHDSSTADYCDVCGAPIAGSAVPAAVGSPAPAAPGSPAPAAVGSPAPVAPPPQPLADCPVCGAPQTGRFCERDGYDFLAASLHPAGAPPVAPVLPPPATPAGLQVSVGADQAYFEKVRAAGGPDAGTLEFPRFLPERRFPLRGGQVLIGRRSRSRGIYPDIDLVGPPEDPGVSHSHALLVIQPGEGWAVVDVGSSNGTYVNDTANAIDVNVPVPLRPGDRIYLGAWTVLTVSADDADAQDQATG
jgi:FHA domain